jgi:lipoate-protein ligase A
VDAQALFDVERFRGEPTRLVLSREADRTTLVLGSTQQAELVSRFQIEEAGVEVVRRRGGGGSVLLQPGDHVWMDAWIPRDDPLWAPDVSAAAWWVGAWWRDALGMAGHADWSVHEDGAAPGELGQLVCFAGRGPGELFVGQRKVVGVSQWRSREGALFLSCAYTQWDPNPLINLFQLDTSAKTSLHRDLVPLAVGLAELDPPVPDLGTLRRALLSSFSAWAPGDQPAG